MATGYAKARRFSGNRSLKDEDFQEEDVWGLMEDLGGSSIPKQRNPKALSASSSSSSSSSRHFPSTPRMIPRKDINPSKEYSRKSSAPVNIPENRQMMFYGSGSPWAVDGFGDHYGGNGTMTGYANSGCGGSSHYLDTPINGDDDDDGGNRNDEDEDEIVPPHEYIARRLARTQISSFSVCEGIGRKLKGRDLSEVRNHVLRKTGFLER